MQNMSLYRHKILQVFGFARSQVCQFSISGLGNLGKLKFFHTFVYCGSNKLVLWILQFVLTVTHYQKKTTLSYCQLSLCLICEIMLLFILCNKKDMKRSFAVLIWKNIKVTCNKEGCTFLHIMYTLSLVCMLCVFATLKTVPQNSLSDWNLRKKI